MSPGLHRRPGHRRTAVLAVAATVLLALVVTSLVLLRPAGGEAPPAPHAVDGASPTPATAGPELSEVPHLSADEVTWVSMCGLELPVSARYGPHELRDDRVRGFAREPGGAVLAALYLVAQTSPQTGPDVFTPTLADQVTGPDLAQFTHAIHAQYEHSRELAQVPYGEPLCPIYATVRGYRLDSYHDDAASLRLLIEAPGPEGLPQLASALVQVVWADGDWRMVAPPRGDWSRVRTLLPPSAAGPYTPLQPQE